MTYEAMIDELNESSQLDFYNYSIESLSVEYLNEGVIDAIKEFFRRIGEFIIKIKNKLVELFTGKKSGDSSSKGSSNYVEDAKKLNKDFNENLAKYEKVLNGQLPNIEIKCRYFDTKKAEELISILSKTIDILESQNSYLQSNQESYINDDKKSNDTIETNSNNLKQYKNKIEEIIKDGKDGFLFKEEEIDLDKELATLNYINNNKISTLFPKANELQNKINANSKKSSNSLSDSKYQNDQIKKKRLQYILEQYTLMCNVDAIVIKAFGILRDVENESIIQSTKINVKLKKSVENAQKAGVPEKDILHNKKEIDDYFTK